MTVRDFIHKHRTVGASVSKMAQNGIAELYERVNNEERWNPPEHVPSQLDLIRDLFDTDEEVWMFFFDAGRYDFFDQLYEDYFAGDLQRCYNGGVGYTGDWTTRHLSQDMGNRGLFSWVLLRGFNDAEYDGRKWFAEAPDIQSELETQEQLAALGYAERQTDDEIHISPEKVNKSVRQHKDDLNGGVIRYLKPHPPFGGLPDLTAESTKTMKTQQALDAGELSYAELVDAYRETYKIAFEHAVELIPELDGKVVITSDHGTCLTCGQLFHGRRLDMHDHLTVMPWFEVDKVL